MTSLPYDVTDPHAILEHAKGLAGRSLAEAVGKVELLADSRNKGDLGALVERHFFGYEPNSNHGPDFVEAGVELKTTGVIKRSGSYRAKERLVLTMINYVDLVNEDWGTSSLMAKCKLMLLLFYLYQKELPSYDRKFVLNPLLFSFPEEDLKVIKDDWKKIQQKIKEGKAHELSEGDTDYLGACRKGTGGLKEVPRVQPFSDIPAKARAFSLKPSYVNRIITGHATEAGVLDAGTIIRSGMEQATYEKFKPFLGKTVDEISDLLDYRKESKNQKGFYRSLTMRMLGGSKEIVPEFEKGGIELKTIRVNKDWMPREAMSFPGFKYMEIIDEEWEDSSFFEKIEQKFLFAIFRYGEDGKLRFEKVTYWNMPYEDRVEAQRVWEDTKRRVGLDASDLPRIAESPVAHVRPKAQNARDVIPTPQGEMLPKKCFWLNQRYIAQQIRK